MPLNPISRRRSKFNAHRCVLDGHTFASAKERDRYCVLKTAEQRGEIHELVVHPLYRLFVNNQRVANYIGDFEYLRDGTRTTEDVKGYKKGSAYRLFRLKAKLMKAIYDIDVVEI